ncbi:MAG: CrcB family protein [Planctomycetaceae bacterium]|jgi:CrcB protein|nr:CrcB family protein [Planctomycetaceae bacterium]
MFIQIIGIAIAGAVGTVMRYVLTYFSVLLFGVGFPVGTMAVNLIGAFLFGLVAGLIANGFIAAYWQTIILTGLLGGFTTFSAFAYENQQLIANQKYLYFTINLFGQNILGIAAIILGLYLANLITTHTIWASLKIHFL